MPPAYEVLLLNTAVPQIQAAQSGDTYVVPRDIAFNAGFNIVNNDATIYGVTVGRGAGALSTNTAVGASAFASGSNSGGFGVAVGYLASTSNTTGARNSSVGYGALRDTTTGSDLAAFGYGALIQNTTGSNNTALGDSSLFSNTTASNNTAVGYQAGYSNTTGDQNVALGKTALYSNLIGASNVAVGARTLEANTASYNTGLGFAASFQNTTGTNNLSAGYIALYTNTTGSYNTALGVSALQSNTTASNNTAVGYQAGYSNQTGTSNVAVGYQSLYYTTGSSNTGIGYGAGASITTGAKNTVIGAYSGNQGGLDIRTASNYIVLSDGDGNPRQVINGSGDVGIGTSSPGAKLNVSGSDANGLGIRIDNTVNSTQYLTLTMAGGTGFTVPGWDNSGIIEAVADGVGSGTRALYLGAYNGPILFSTGLGSRNERARITSLGDFQVSSGGSVQVGGTAARATTAGTNRLDIFDGTAPVGTLANGVSFYSASGEANVMDAAGNATLLSPHDAVTNEWIFRSKHTPTGKVLKIDVERLLKFVNDHFGLDAVHEFIEG